MDDQQLIDNLRADLRASLRAELLADGVLWRKDVERVTRWWLLIAVENYDVDWWEFLPGDSPEDACRAFALEWMTGQVPSPRSNHSYERAKPGVTPPGRELT